MFRGFFAVLVVIFLGTLEVRSRPENESGLKGCYEQKCPENTFACRRFTKISEDKKELISEIECLGLSGSVLKNITTSVPNCLGPNVSFQGYSYKAAHESTYYNTQTRYFSDEETNSVNVDKHVPEERSTQFSEIDDLNRPTPA